MTEKSTANLTSNGRSRNIMKHFRKSDSRLHRGRKLDVSLAQDPRNRDFRMGSVLSAPVGELKSKRWECKPRLDQGAEGECVGFGAAHWFACAPLEQSVSKTLARLFYDGAQDHDQWPGSNYEGTSVTGLMRFLTKIGVIGEYRWIFNFEELIQTLSLKGAVIVGAEWREGCFEPDFYGVIRFIGRKKGGHCLCADEVDFEKKRIGFVQSWGRSHGVDGRVYMSFDDVNQLMLTRPSIAFPTEQSLGKYESKPKVRRWWQIWK